MDNIDVANSMCPACGELVLYDVCQSCGFAFSTILKCPNKGEDRNCSRTGLTCQVQSMDWEACPNLREMK